MPNRETFKIKPISELLSKYVKDGKGWIDPFAGDNSPAEITNDLNMFAKATYNLSAFDFAALLEGDYNGVLFDPPYSPRQTKECYNSIGLSPTKYDTGGFPSNVKKEISRKIKLGGVAICFGWNSNGFGKKLGFEVIEILMVSHGANHNDTIVTVEKKMIGKPDDAVSDTRKLSKEGDAGNQI